MPIHEYICNDCNGGFQWLLRSSSEIVSCPKCKSQNLKRLMSGFTFYSKGASGVTTPGSSCSGCSSSNCSSCGK